MDSRTNQKNVTHVKVVKTSEFGKPNSEESSSAEQEIGVGIITAKPKEMAQVASGGSYLLIADAYSRIRERSTPKQMKFKVFLDNGSQKSFITKRLAEQLNLPHEKVEVLSISTFNQRSPQVVESPVVTMELLLKNGEQFPMTLNVMPSLTGPMRRATLSPEDREVLRKFPTQLLAEPVTNQSLEFKPDVLIGQNYSWELINNESKQRLPLSPPTKRKILHCIDPMGLIAPCLLLGKNFLHKLWKEILSWVKDKLLWVLCMAVGITLV
ncbi:MAG: hypothetical protein GY820_29850, partial [Gammaproteobacteria bacterium]|nr:hypothetical protein [Gammaproteobacteria bacterium]